MTKLANHQFNMTKHFFSKSIFEPIFALTLVLALSIILSISCFSAASAYAPEGFADIVEPLMPAVVNINTVKYAKKTGI